METQTQAAVELQAKPMGGRRPRKKLLGIGLVFLACLIFGGFAGRLLVRDHPEKSDVIVVLAGDSQDERYRHGMELLRAGYGKHLFLDASSDSRYFGHTPAEYAQAFVERDAGDMLQKVSICPFEDDSTFSETAFVARCLAPLQPQSVLLVTSDWHTARARSVFAKLLPQYHWAVAAARDPRMFGVQWWRHREWAKTALEEWCKVIWWNTVDRWRSPSAT